MDDAIEGFLYFLKVEQHRSANTVESYGRDVRRFGRWLADQGVLTPQQITQQHLTSFLVHLEDGAVVIVKQAPPVILGYAPLSAILIEF